MSIYRVGSHHGVTIIREGDGYRCGVPGHDCERGHLIGVMLTAEDAAEVVAALNEREAQAEDPHRRCFRGDADCPWNGADEILRRLRELEQAEEDRREHEIEMREREP